MDDWTPAYGEQVRGIDLVTGKIVIGEYVFDCGEHMLIKSMDGWMLKLDRIDPSSVQKVITKEPL